MANGEVMIGRTADGHKVYVRGALGYSPGPRTTIEHKTVDGVTRVSFQGTVVRKGGSYSRDGDWLSSGQISLTEYRVTSPTLEWQGKLLALTRAWSDWHLNDMRAGCAHQSKSSVVYREGRYGREIDLDNTPACPETGYKYGTAWLSEEPPASVVEFVAGAFKLSGGFWVRDEAKVSPWFPDESDAFAWLQRHQPMSVDWAVSHEGYSYKRF